MKSPEPRLKPDPEPSGAAGVAWPAGSESKQGPNTTTPSQAESLLAAEKRTLEMMANGASLSEVLNDLCASIDAHAPPTTSMVCLMDPDGKQLLPGAGPHLPAAFTAAITPWPIGANRGSCGTAAFTKQRVIIPDISNDPRWPDEARDLALNHGFCAAWSEPLISSDGEVLGTFCMSYAEPRIPNSRDLELIEAASHIALIAIELERSHQAIKKALVEIKNSENRLRTIIDTIPALAWSARPDGSAEFFNRRWLDYAGLSPQQASDWGWTVALHPEDRGRLVDYWRRVMASGEAGEIEARLRRFDGEYRWFLFRASPLRNDSGRIVKWYGTNTDLEERKRAEDVLRSNEQNLRLILDSIPGFVSTANAAGEVELVNRQVAEYFGKTTEELKNWATTDALHPDDLPRLTDAYRHSIETGQPRDVETRSRGADGVYRWFHLRSLPQRDAEGRVVRWYTLATDIDQRKRAEAELEKAFGEIKRLKDRLHDENVVLREQIDQAFMFEEIVGSSPALKTVLSSIVKVAPADSTVLITGETGTGKELIARAIHKGSQRAGQAFITVNCASIPSSLIASELFGHEKGAFTGALQRHQGRFELAHSGTIFLDEIGELPAETQIALLRVLQERQFERVGGSRVIPTDVRIIAATNRDLSAAIAAGAFRADLFYRLNVFPIHVPPLRNRKEDIPMLVEYFVRRYAEKTGKQISKIDKNTLKLCQSYQWPGNIRELQNIVERSVILCTGDTFWIDEAWLSSQNAPRPEPSGPLTKTLRSYEKELIEAALAESNGKVAGPNGAAAKLGIPRSTLDLKIKQLNIKKITVR
ncbi:MAG TPA: sigma 54-interacting transcriptional regulator [Candidatus Cybelea sp.]|nr:sigma 54-interacting transcriptional regulator [Candidatus Cybelea sp.]